MDPLPPHSGPDDATLLARTAAGDESAFACFVDRHEARLWRSLHLRSGNDADAEDAMQQTFLAAWQHAGSFRGQDARAWLASIARHALTRLHRRPTAIPLTAMQRDPAPPRHDPEAAPGAIDDWCTAGLEAAFPPPSAVDALATSSATRTAVHLCVFESNSSIAISKFIRSPP